MSITLDKIKEISSRVNEWVDGTAIEEHLTFSEAGLDSLDTYSVFLKIEEELNISIPEKDIDKIQTFKDLLDYTNQSGAK